MVTRTTYFVGSRIITSDRVFDVMCQVDRAKYTHSNPYLDSPQGIGFGATISAPHMVIILISQKTKMFHLLYDNCYVSKNHLTFMRNYSQYYEIHHYHAELS